MIKWLCAKFNLALLCLMSASGLPTATELLGIRALPDLFTLLGLRDDVWTAFVGQAGDPGNSIRVLAALPQGAVRNACLRAVMTDGSAFAPMLAAHVGLVWRSSRKIVHMWAGLPDEDFCDVDLWEEDVSGRAQGTGSGTPTPSPPQIKERLVKMSSVLDQADDSELVPAARADIDVWMSRYVAIMGAPPSEEEEATEEQSSALNKRVNVLSQAPYCDFAIFQPFGRRALKALKFRVYWPLGDGSYVLKELPGCLGPVH